MNRFTVLGLLGMLVLGACSSEASKPEPAPSAQPAPTAKPDLAAGLKAFDTIHAVLMHPRCLNCHPSGDRPLQTDTSADHIMNVQRGPDNHGRAGLRCSTCHHETAVSGPKMPPGIGKDWHLAPKAMAFQGRTKRGLALMLADSKQSGLDGPKLVEHVRHDKLVSYGWDPGKGRTKVPVSRAELVEAFQTWVDAGMPAPKE